MGEGVQGVQRRGSRGRGEGVQRERGGGPEEGV